MDIHSYAARLRELEAARREGYERRMAGQPQPLPVVPTIPPEQIARNQSPALAYWRKFERGTNARK